MHRKCFIIEETLLIWLQSLDNAIIELFWLNLKSQYEILLENIQ